MTWEEYKAMKNKDATATIEKNEVRTSKNSIDGMSWQEYKQKREEQRRIEEEQRKREEEQRKIEAQKQEQKRQEIINKQTSQTANNIVNDINSGKDLTELQKAYGNLSMTEQAALAKKAQETANSTAGKLGLVGQNKPVIPITNLDTSKLKTKEDLDRELADQKADETLKKAAGTVTDVTLNTAQGFAGVGENIADFLAAGIAEAAEKTGHKEYAERVRRNIASSESDIFTNTLQKGKDAIGDYSWSGDTLDQMFQGVGQTGAYAALNAIPGAGSALSTGAMFTSAAGGELSELYGSEDYKNGDLRNGKIWAKAIGSGAIEAAAERMLGYFGSSGGIDKTAANYLSNLASTSIGKIFARQGVNALAEGVEEVISYTGNYLLDSVIDWVDKQTGGTGEALRQPWNWQDLWQQAFTAAGSALIMGGFDTAVTAKSVNGTSVSDALNKTAQKMDLNAQLEGLQSQEKKLQKRLGKNISQQEIGNTFNELQNIQNQAANIQSQLEALQQQNIAPIENIIEQNNTILPKARDSFLETAKQYNIDTNSETIQSINRIMNERGINASFNSELFTDNSQNAIWKISKDENGEVTREVVLNPNSDSKKTLQNIVIHELTHDLEGTAEHNELRDLILEYDKKQINYEDARKSLENIYSKVYDPNSSNFQTLVENEAVADILGNKLGDQEFINNLTMKKPSLGRKIYNWVVDKLNKLTGYSNEKLFWQDVKNKFENAYRQDYQNNNNDIKYSKEVLSDGTKYIKLDNKLFQNQDGTLKTAREAYNTLVGKTLNLDDGTEVKILKSLPKKDLYNELSKRRPRSKNVENISEMNNKINGNLDESIESSSLINTRPDVNSRHIEQGIKNFDTREVYLFDGTGAYRLTLSIAELQSGEKVAYAKKNLTYDKQLTEKIKNELSSSSTSNNGRSSRMITPNNSIASSNENVNTIKYSIQESENNSGSFSMQDNKGRILTKEQQEYLKDVSQKLRDENGNIKEYYHGTQRADRVGNYFDPNKATSGPMAFFTDNFDIAKSYSENKQDTSISREADTEYDLFKSNGKDLDTYWNSLTKQQQEEINKKGRAIGFDEDYENIVYDENHDSFSGQYDYYLKNEEHNNGIKALYDVFIQDGNLFGEDMAKFKDVLALAGIKDVEYLDPYKIDSKVYNVYLKIKNPFDTSSISSEIFKELDKASKHAPTQIGYSADQWDKSNVTPIQWMNRLKDDIKNGTTHAWTSIPDWVTNVLKNNGYDGIVDIGGKNGGEEHQVVIPFYSNQIKNVDNTNPTDNPDIRYSQNNQIWQSYLDKNYKNTGKGQTIQELKLTTANNNVAPSVANNKLATSEYTEKQSKIKEQEQIAKILDEPITKEKEKSRAWAIAKANLIDKGIVFEELSHKTKNRELQGKWDYMLTSGARGQNAIGRTRYDMDSNNKTKKQISKSLEDIRSEVGKNTSQFQNYMYHQLNIDRMTLQERFGKENKPVFGDNISAEYSRQKVAKFEKAHPEFKEYAQDVYDFLDANKKELVDRGVISQELSDKLQELYPHYVPIKRVDAKGAAIKVPLDTYRTGVNSPLEKATGGSSDIQPMFQTIADRTLQTYRASARNNFGVELMNTLNSTTESMQTDIDSIIEEIGDENTELLKEGKNGQNPTFTVFNNGEKVTFEITKDMYEALKPQSEFIKNMNNSKLAKGLNKVSNFRRGVLTEYNPIFSLTNAMKDAQDVVVNSQHPAKTFAKFGESYVQILQKGYWYNEYIQNGGEQNSYFKDGEFESDKKQSKLKTAIKVPFDAISKVNNVIEMAPRLAEYIASRESGRSIETSMLDAARVTTNFKAGGDITKTLNRNGATFLNASVQGFQQQVRNIQEAHVKGLKGYAVLAAKYAVAGLPALLLNGLIWKDDEDYNNLQDYAKDNYYIIAKYGDGKFIRIPKGRVAATAQKIVSNVTEYLTDDKKSLNIDNLAKDFWEDIKFAQDNIAPNNPLDNNVLSPIIQAMTNKTWYGTDLVPTRLQNKPKKEQYDETTDSLSIWLGNKLNVSPYKINYLLDQYGGGLADITLPRMTKQAENNVFTDKFTTDSVMKNKYPGEFYSELDDLKVKANSIDAKDEDVLKYKYNSSVSSQMSKLYAEKREIQNSNMTDKQKKEQLRVVQNKINNLAREALEGTETTKVSGNTATINDTQYYKTTSNDETKWNKITDKEKEKNQDISLKTYADYKNKVIGKSKDSEKIQVLVDSSYSNKEKLALYENYVNSNDKNISLVKDLNINTDEYLKYKLNAGTKKAEKVSYMENTMRNVSYMNKLMLLGTEYALSSNEKNMIYNYVIGLNKTKQQKMELLSRIKGFTVSENGTVRY